MKQIFFLLILISCAIQKPNTEIETVSINSVEDNKLTIKESKTDLIGPVDDSTDSDAINEIKEKNPVISLSIYSSIYSSLALVNLFKQLEKEEINISFLNANGFATVVCALYAKEKNSNTLEWKLFALLKQLEGQTPYKQEWRSAVANFLAKEFKGLKLEDLKLSLQIPFVMDGKVYLESRGAVEKVVLQNLDINDKSNYFLKPAIYKRNLVENNTDLNFNLVFLPEQIKFKLIDGYSWGIFTNYFGFLMKNSELISKVSTTKSMYVDELLPLSDINNAYQTGLNEIVEKFHNEIKQWREEITTSSN